MPKKTPRNKQRVPFSGSPRSAASLLADIKRGAVHSPSGGGEVTDAVSLRDHLRVCLGALGTHVLQARMRDGALVVYVESAAWATRLRLGIAELIADRSAPLPGVGPETRVVVRIMPREGYRR